MLVLVLVLVCWCWCWFWWCWWLVLVLVLVPVASLGLAFILRDPFACFVVLFCFLLFLLFPLCWLLVLLCRAARLLRQKKQAVIEEEAAEFWLQEPRPRTSLATGRVTFADAAGVAGGPLDEDEDDDVERYTHYLTGLRFLLLLLVLLLVVALLSSWCFVLLRTLWIAARGVHVCVCVCVCGCVGVWVCGCVGVLTAQQWRVVLTGFICIGLACASPRFFHRRSVPAARRFASVLRELAAIAEKRSDGMMHPAALRRMADADPDRRRSRDLRDVARVGEYVSVLCWSFHLHLVCSFRFVLWCWLWG